MSDLVMRPLEASDLPRLWEVLEPVFRAGDTYAVDPDIPRDAALAYWTGGGRRVYAAEAEGRLVGSFYLVRNQPGGGSHVCNCGFVTDPAARGRGVARRMLDHALQEARHAGFRAMQFNFVVSTNSRAVALWEGAGFATLARLPGAFHHPQAGYVDALVMYRDL